MKNKSETYEDIWDVLSVVDVSNHIKKKNNLSYLSWTFAHQVMMENYPEYVYTFHDTEYHKDGSASVHCSVYVADCRRDMFLPVMTGFTNAAKANPSARDVGDAKMRCLVKCLAMFGLGNYIYAGEDIPQDNPRAREKVTAGKKETAQKESVTKGSSEPTQDRVPNWASEPAPTSEPIATSDPGKSSMENLAEISKDLPKKDVSDEEKDVHRAAEETFTVFATGAEAVSELATFWKENMSVLKMLEGEAPDRYGTVLQSFKDKKAELSAAAAEAASKE